LPAGEVQADLVERAHVLAADPVFAHHVAKFNRELVPWCIAGIASFDHGPPAKPQHSAGRGELSATDLNAHADVMPQRPW
jgi:hypothetical protein